MSNSLTRKLTPSKIGLAIAAPLAAAIFSILISSLAVIASKKSPVEAFKTMWEFGTTAGSLMEVINTATPYYIAAIGFNPDARSSKPKRVRLTTNQKINPKATATKNMP